MKSLRRLLTCLLILVGTAALTILYLAHSERGAQWAVTLLTRALDQKLTVGQVHGAFSNQLVLTSVAYHDTGKGIDARFESVLIELDLRSLLTGHLRILNLEVQDSVVTIRPAAKSETSSEPFASPIDIELVRFTLTDAELRWAEQSALVLSRLSLQARLSGNRIALRSMELISPQGSIVASGELLTREPFVGDVTGQMQWQVGERHFAGKLTTRSRAQTIDILCEVRKPVLARVSATMTTKPRLAWTLKVGLPSFDVQQVIAATSPIQEAAAELSAHGDLRRAWIEGHVQIDRERIEVEKAQVSVRDGAITFDVLSHVQQRTGRVEIATTISTDRTPMHIDARVRLHRVTIPMARSGSGLLASGQFELSGDSSHAISTGAMVTEMSKRTANVAWNVRGTTKHIEVEELSLHDDRGRLSARGYLDRTANLRWHIDAEANGFDPSTFASGWRGSVDMSVATEGELTEAAPSGWVRVKKLRGVLRGRALSGSGILRLTHDKRVEGELQLRSGDAHLRIVGQREAAVNLLAELDLPSLADWHPQASGSVRSRFRAQGRWPRLSVEGSARAAGIQWQDFRATSISLQLDARGPSRPSGRVRLEAADVLANNATFSVVTAQVAGTEREHTLEVQVAGQPLTVVGLARGTLLHDRWLGSLTRFDLDVQDAPSVSLQAPTSIELSRSRVSISESCLAGGEIKLCLAGDWQRGGAAQVAYSIRELPLNLIARMAFRDERIAVEGTLQGTGNLKREATGAGSGTAQLTSVAGGITRIGERGASLQFRDLALKAMLNGGTARAEVGATLGQSGSLGANISFADLQTSAPTLMGSGSIRIPDLSAATALVPELSNLRGVAEAAFTVEGPARTPTIAANASIMALQTEIPALGLKLRDGALTLRMQPPEGLQMSGQVTSGAGVLKLNGEGESATSFTVGIEGTDVTAFDVPGALVVIAPRLQFSQSSRTTTLAGTLDVPRADVDLESLTARSSRRISSDVVVVGRKIEIEKAATAMNADVNVAFGKNVKLKGFGLDGQISGGVRVKEVAAGNSTGYGQLDVAGTYEVYGRKLDIERARLVFADTSLDDPQLDVLATRKLPEATINVSVTGTAQHPKLAITSDDDMTQTEALSYLLTGKPPDELRQDEGAMLQSAKSSLGTMVGDQLARRFGQKLGVDNIGVEENAELGSSALTIGKYLSPRFFVSYGVALFEPGSVMTLRYTINDKVSVKANQAPDSQHAGVEYRIER